MIVFHELTQQFNLIRVLKATSTLIGRMMAAVNTVNGLEALKGESDFLSKFATVSVTRRNLLRGYT
jgi:hypothetical protein